METIRLKVSFEGNDLEPILAFVNDVQQGRFTDDVPIIQSTKIDDLRLEDLQESSILYGTMF